MKPAPDFCVTPELPTSAAKEIEYVLDLSPAYLWVVGPGSVDPVRYVYRVELDGPLNAKFEPVQDLPAPPLATS